MRLSRNKSTSVSSSKLKSQLKSAATGAAIELLETRRMLSTTTVTVNSTLDTLFSPSSGLTSLRNAFNTAENDTTDSTFIIKFDSTAFNIAKTISLTGGPLTLDDTDGTLLTDIEIEGPTAGVTIDASGQDGGIAISPTALDTVDLSNLTVQNAAGVGVSVNVDEFATLNLTSVTLKNNSGGAVYTNGQENSSLVTATSSVISGNSASGITADNVTLTNTTVAGNTGWGVSAAGQEDNGGSVITLKGSTISGNTAGGIQADVVNATDSTLSGNSGYAISYQPFDADPNDGTLLNDTIANNAGGIDTSATADADDDSSQAGPYITLGNMLIAGNTATAGTMDVNGPIESEGHNLIGVATSSNNYDGSGGWIASDLLGSTVSPINAQLGALANNGGATLTMLPATTSPAVNAGSNALITGTTTDQRGATRIVASTVDIGSVEVGAPSIVVTAPASQTATTGASKSFTLGSFTGINTTAPFTVAVHWGDGSATTTLTQATAGAITAQSHTYTTAGTDSVTVTVTDASGANSSASFNVTTATTLVSTALSVAASAPSINSNQAVTLTATLTPATSGASAASGSVTFYEGTTVLGTAAISAGTASLLTTTALPAGADAVSAAYSGDAVFASSIAPAVDIAVASTGTITTLGISLVSKTVAQSVTLTATVAPATAGSINGLFATGTISFSEAGTLIGVSTLNSAGAATLTTIAALPAGDDSIIATYSGDSAFATSASAAGSLLVTDHALLPAISKVSVPKTAVAGVALKGSVSFKLTNELSGTETGIETGAYSATLYASPTTTVDPAVDAALASVAHITKLAEGKALKLGLSFTKFPAALAAGVYHLLLQSIDSKGNSETIDTGSTVAVAAPVITLSAVLGVAPASAVKKGATVTLTNAGNIADTGVYTATVAFSSDAAGKTIVATGAGVLHPNKFTLKAGKSGKLKVTGWQAISTALPAGSYYLVVTLTDASGHSATAVSATNLLL